MEYKKNMSGFLPMNNIFRKLHQYGIYKFIKFFFEELRSKLYYQLFLGSYGQHQEDLILDQLLHHKQRGFYVDIGAYDPIRFNNTMRFYKRGWHGINIEPGVDQWKNLCKARPRDINLNIGIGLYGDSLTYYSMDPPTLSTFSQNQASAYIRQKFVLWKKVKVKVLPLREIFEKCVKSKQIDFISIDVEGMEMEVLKSNDWKKYRPQFLCIEIETPGGKRQLMNHPVHIYLKKQGYQWIKNNHTNAFFKRDYEN
jgi:FkbM family methyltransferase